MEEIKKFIENYIPQMNNLQKVYQLFEGLGYKILDPSFKGKEAFGLKEKDREVVKEIYTIANYKKRFQIFLIEVTQLSSSIIRNLPLYFERETQYPFFVFTTDYRQYTFVLVEKSRQDVGEWKRKTVRLNLDRENAYYTDKWILSEIAIKDEEDPIKIYDILKKSFNVEKVTNKFFEEYINTFDAVKGQLLKQTKDPKSAHDFTQQLLNRIMFIYFVAKKRWLGNDLKFMTTFWDIYCRGKKKGEYEPDTFYDGWLSVLFFEAFNNRFSPRKYFPDELNKTLMLAPYLNGGLFSRNRLDDVGFSVKDPIFEMIFTFLNRYNFTIREELPLEEEVAVDPEMIGRVYESLVNLSEEEGERYAPGIFYTDRVEIDFMSRRSLVEYFYNQFQVENVSKEIIFKFVFAKTDDDKKEAEKELNKLKIWEGIEEVLDNLSVVDPACGSGSFLVGMLNILADLYKLTYKNLNRPIDDFEIKKQIIGRSLYGVDVIEWAVHVAELRLWLQLIVESELSLGELKVKPLLPNLTFKLRPGDSLVQEIGGVNLALRNNKDISPALKRKLTELKQEKLKFYNNEPSRKFKTEELILHEELNIFRAILDERILNLTNKIKEKQKSIGKKEERELFAIEEVTTAKSRQQHFEMLKQIDKKTQEEIEYLTQEKDRLIEISDSLDKETKPFIWDIDFVEIFTDELEGGFDVVIGNPPYVRQEKIADPKLPKEKITNENKKDYKEKLVCSAQNDFPFLKSINKKSDLYIYFYLKGLSLLNRAGTLCFITSNSWLDVEYGKELQEFLLNSVKIHAIYDNLAKRSFARADINTIIALFSSSYPLKPICETKIGEVQRPAIDKECIAKFVMYRKPFEDVITVENLLKIEETDDILKTDDFRVYPKRQIELLEEGWQYPEGVTEEEQKIHKLKIGKYEGNKWGGKYLRAPDIFFTILEKGKNKLIRLGDIAEVRFGIKTGANEFFYLDEEQIKNWKIENEFLQPIIKSPREIQSIIIDSKKLPYRVFMCHESKNKLKGTYALKYIEYGERQGYDKGPTCQQRHTNKKSYYGWYDLGKREKCGNISPQIINELMRTILNGTGDNLVYASDVVLNIFYDEKIDLWFVLNSIITQMFVEQEGRIALGEGALKVQIYEAEKIFVLNPKFIKDIKKTDIIKKMSNRKMTSIFDECGFNPQRSIRDQEPNPLPDRKELDEIIFDILDLTKEERKEVYWAVCELVKNRLEKAKSV